MLFILFFAVVFLSFCLTSLFFFKLSTTATFRQRSVNSVEEPLSLILCLTSLSTRDRAFISVVRAPRVILLIHNEKQTKTQTHVLITTIANAWPMLLFILVTASLSGIIIWFLVSVRYS